MKFSTLTDNTEKSRLVVRICLFMAITIVLGMGCASRTQLGKEKVDALLNEYRKKNVELKKKLETWRDRGINHMEVFHRDNEMFVTLDLKDASIPAVINRMLQESGMSYHFDNSTPYGTGTYMFKEVPFFEALARLLDPIMMMAEYKDNIITVKDKPIGKKAKEETFYSEVVPLENISVAVAEKMLEQIFPSKGGKTKGKVDYSKYAGKNMILLKGNKYDVLRTIRLLKKADKQSPHIIIEALVIDFSIGDLINFGAELQGLQKDIYSNLNIDYSLTDDIISFTRNDSSTSTKLSFSSVLNLLVSDSKARLVSRPYVSTISGEESEINIIGERYIITINDSGSTTTKIPAGVTLKITPTVLTNGKINMKLYVEESSFARSTLSSVDSETYKKSVNSVMEVYDGHTTAIGGLVLNSLSTSDSGFPFLRHVPIANLLMSKKTSDFLKRDVVIFLTPHIWVPDMDTPIIKKGLKDLSEKKAWQRIF